MRQIPVNCYVCGSGDNREFQHVVRRTDDGSGGAYRVAECRVCGSIELHLGAMDASPFADQSFDCIVMRNTLEHLFDPAKELQICHRLLKPGGLFYLKVPNGNYEHGWRCRLMMRQSHVFGPPWHLNYFTQATLRRLLLQKGFAVADWLIESPTPDSHVLLNAAQQTAFAVFRATRLLTLGALFPKPVLTCIAWKLPVSRPEVNAADAFAVPPAQTRKSSLPSID